jgi:hypothetical protein
MQTISSQPCPNLSTSKHYNPGSGGVKTRKLNIISVVLRARPYVHYMPPRTFLDEYVIFLVAER